MYMLTGSSKPLDTKFLCIYTTYKYLIIVQ